MFQVESYSLPDSVARHVSVVGELVRFPRMRFAAKELVTTELLASAPNASVAAEWSACGASNAKYANPHVQSVAVCDNLNEIDETIPI